MNTMRIAASIGTVIGISATLWLASQAQELQTKFAREALHNALDSFEVLTPDEARTLKPHIALYWVNNARETDDGLTAFWLLDGHPEAVAAIFPRNGQLVHTFDSLSRGGLIAKESGKTIWEPQGAGLEFKPVPNAPAPAVAKRARQLQMKEIARQFGATMLGWKRDESEREVLRLLPRPLYVYPESSHKPWDGAVFGFTSGTDPEVLLILEAIGEEGPSRWEFGTARQTSGELELRQGDQVVWHADAYPETKDPKGTHLAFVRPFKSHPEPER